MLIASLVGIDTRATMDLDATLRNLPLKKEEIERHDETIIKDKDGGELDE